MSLPSFPHPPSDRILIIGAGIVGSHLASFLSSSLGSRVILSDKDVRGLPGSTGHAPGFVGQYNELSPLTELAKRSVRHYVSQGGDAFQVVGGLEIGSGLEKRGADAKSAGIQVEVMEKERIMGLVPDFINEDCVDVRSTSAGLFFPQDGTANAIQLTHLAQDQASKNGAILLNAEVKSHVKLEEGWKVITSVGDFEVGKVVFCTGIWASQLLPSLEHSVVSVAHPYSYSIPHEERPNKMPFIRWPHKHVYARDHGTKDGLGSYAHAPVKVPRQDHGQTAYGKWEDEFDSVLQDGYELLNDTMAKTFSVEAEGSERFNGLFSVTPDGMPLVGQIQDGMYCAVGVWVTHAAGSARLLAETLLGDGKKDDEWLRTALDPKRFDRYTNEEKNDLEKRSLAKYNDIYNKEGQSE
ncbi:uncharacterized protein I303_104950 [Kwoniella dejecticola CBS 10117]|uniref:FAD dependent oxidoreductase domain-containing protein n=1 Tax=Kwoniella dejecticola CBS 10117 TaxID=1296121 RepID=A0A1A6A3V8_9TREE|nr:uncharacterized protein I303_05604 [Kwoniella dejecticola CBS 10117]OBR84745.1 hypothetical protein I303_05604 [Kwoniella dejecticola CBS 10117]